VVGDGGVRGRADDRVAALIERLGVRRLLYLGDVYENGTAREFRDYYSPGFGRFKTRTYPVPGNHEWRARKRGYDRYWAGRMRRSRGRHYYAFDIGNWHFVALNSEEPHGRGSRQLAWLRDHMAARRDDCTMAIVHRPRFNAGEHGDARSLAPAFALLRGKAVAVFSGHDHNYQRFNPREGITQFVVGTGGRHRYDVDRSDRALAASDDGNFGALRLTLRRDRAEHVFVALDGRERDRGELTCEPAR